MPVTLNGENKTIETPVTLQDLLDRFGYHAPSIAVAIDGSFIPRQQYAARIIRDHETLDILSPMQGG